MWDEGFCCADRPKHVHRAENLFVRKTFKRTRETVAGIVEQSPMLAGSLVDAFRMYNPALRWTLPSLVFEKISWRNHEIPIWFQWHVFNCPCRFGFSAGLRLVTRPGCFLSRNVPHVRSVWNSARHRSTPAKSLGTQLQPYRPFLGRR